MLLNWVFKYDTLIKHNSTVG